jgi:hypothetical protein
LADEVGRELMDARNCRRTAGEDCRSAAAVLRMRDAGFIGDVSIIDAQESSLRSVPDMQSGRNRFITDKFGRMNNHH